MCPAAGTIKVIGSSMQGLGPLLSISSHPLLAFFLGEASCESFRGSLGFIKRFKEQHWNRAWTSSRSLTLIHSGRMTRCGILYMSKSHKGGPTMKRPGPGSRTFSWNGACGG